MSLAAPHSAAERSAITSPISCAAGARPEASRPSEAQGLEAERSYSTVAGMTFDGSGITASAASATLRAQAHSEQSITAGES